MDTVFLPPDELEFFDRGFGLSAAHAPNDCVYSFGRAYADGSELTLTFEVGLPTALHTLLTRQGKVVSAIAVEGITGVSFQSWHGERTIRCEFARQSLDMDLRIHFDPAASLHFSAGARYG